MKTSANGRKFIETFEGLVLGAYDDANNRILKPGDICHGTLTIGYGHTSAAGPPRVYIGMAITEAEADAILSADLASVEIEVGHLITASLVQYQFDALNSFQYNTGWLARPECSLRRALNAGNYQLADIDFALYDRASGKVEQGLVRRRKAEALMFAGNITAALEAAKA
jgi:lysozyme